MPRRLSSLPLVALLVALVVSGCSVAGGTPAPSSKPAGTYTSTQFQPPVTYTIPSGWDQPTDSSTYFDLIPAGTDIGGIYLFADPQPASQDSGCPASPAPGIIAKDSTTLMNWVRGRPGLTASTPTLVTMDGLPGVQLDVAIKNGWTGSCPFAPNGMSAAPLFALPGSSNPWTIAGSERLRLFLLDRPGGGTIVIDIDAFDGSVWDALLAEAMPIVQGMTFKTS